MAEIINPYAGGAQPVLGFPVAGRTDHRSTGAAGGAATVAKAVDTERGYVVSQIDWSYSTTPTGGGLTIADGTGTLFNIDIAAAGPGGVKFEPPLLSAKSSALTVTLAAPGGAVVGKVNCVIWKM